ncbi:hypothetical protein HA466_0304500 [Hirschfeldia incana]|nr:hypothetical protein HA466_0304500 [Hirschfeldia incana]
MEKEEDYTASFCPSFSSYANDGLVETAERVRLECSGEYNNNEDDGFEFVNMDYEAAASFSGDCDLVFPVFNQAIISKPSAVISDGSSRPAVTTRLRDLFLLDREDSSSSSSSDEEKELDGVSSELYCPWTPEKLSKGVWRKSKSTGSSSSSSSSRRWRIRDLLKRSYSEGKQSLSFLNSNSRNRVEEAASNKVSSSAHEKFYLKKKAKKEEEKRKSYLPYKQFGLFFFNVHHR